MPVFLLATPISKAFDGLIPISLEHLTVQHGLQCRLERGDGTVDEETFTVVNCLSRDLESQLYFLEVIALVISTLGEEPSARAINLEVLRLGELFRALAQPPQQSTQGLWGELFTIARAPNPHALVQAWRQHPKDRFDFRLGEVNLEVKSFSGSIRQHHFSLEQLRPGLGQRVLVVSLRVVRSDQGTSLRELADEIKAHLVGDDSSLLRFNQSLALTLGNGFRAGMRDSFDEQVAYSSLALYNAMAIPSVTSDLPPEIGEVRFTVDLTQVKALTKVKGRVRFPSPPF